MNIVSVQKTCEIINGFAFESDLFNTQRIGLPVVRIRDVVRGFSKTYYSGPYDEAYEVGHGDLLIGMDGEFNIAKWRGGRALLNQRVCKIVAKPEIADSSYLKYRLGLLIKEIEDRTPFVTVKHLSSDDLKAAEIELPQVAEQKRIAAILDKADRLRRQRRFAQTLSDSFLQSVFIKMFGDPVANPVDWPEDSLRNLRTKFDYGTSQKCGYSKVGLPVLRIPNILSGEIDPSDLKFTKLGLKEAEKLTLKSGNLIFVRTNGNLEYVGRSAVFNRRETFLFASYLIRARLNTEKLNPVFVSFYLRTPGGRRIMFPNIRTTAGQYNISTEGLGNIVVPIPPPPLQEKFAAIVQKFERIRRQQREATRQAEHLFQTLLHRAFRGEI